MTERFTPAPKSLELETFMTAIFGFDRTKKIEAGLCVPPPYGCGKKVTAFKDALSEKEYTLSGMCQACQDAFFVEPEDEECGIRCLTGNPCEMPEDEE